MTESLTVTIHSIAEDGLPDMNRLTGRVAFIFDGCIVSGWPVDAEDHDEDPELGQLWEGNSDVANGRLMANVTHWVEFPAPVWEIGQL